MKNSDMDKLLKKLEAMLEKKLKPLQSIEGLRKAVLMPEEDKVQLQWDKIHNEKLREMGFKI